VKYKESNYLEGKDGKYIETKLCMFADDTQLCNKNDESVKKSVDICFYFSKRGQNFSFLSIIDFHISSFCIL
jgi:hypothetical protein